MNLIKEHWTKKDIEEFYEYQKTLIGCEKDCEWEQRIVNTKLKCFGKTSGKAREVVKEIKKGNYFEFLENFEIKTHFDSLVVAFLINNIKDYDMFEKYLDKYVLTIDNWASCDTLKFNKRDFEKLSDLSLKYLKSDRCFVRRVGINFYFDMIKKDNYIDNALSVIDNLKNEKEYYVNMCAAWLLSFCFVINRDKTLNFFKNNNTNDFIINKAISKCRDSFRVSNEDKQMLVKFRR